MVQRVVGRQSFASEGPGATRYVTLFMDMGMGHVHARVYAVWDGSMDGRAGRLAGELTSNGKASGRLGCILA